MREEQVTGNQHPTALAAAAASLRDAATAVENANFTQAGDILGDVFSEGGVRDALSDVLASARDLIMTRLPAGQWAEHPAGYELYHQLAVTAEDLRDQTHGLRDASRVLRELPDTAPPASRPDTETADRARSTPLVSPPIPRAGSPVPAPPSPRTTR
jgi:hypothetical protein